MAFRKAITNKTHVFLPDVRVAVNGRIQSVTVHVNWIDKPDPLHGTVLVIFSDILKVNKVKPQTRKGIKAADGILHSELEEELHRTREEVRNTVEEMQTSQEELKSANEELQSTNEELQSTNEELTTSKEEMQSLNEELQTVNAELQSKVDDLSG